jgi:hypothetical protein
MTIDSEKLAVPIRACRKFQQRREICRSIER